MSAARTGGVAPVIFRQIRSHDGTGTLTYLLGDPVARRAVVIDPNINDVDAILLMALELGVGVDTVIDTHTHADHVSGATELKRRTGARLVMHELTKEKWKVVDQGDILRANAAHEVDRYVAHGETVTVGSIQLQVLLTPGHTDNHISIRSGDMLFTGDLLLIGQAGRSDLPGGSTGQQYDSLFGTVASLPDSTRIYPGHDYAGREFALLGNERRTNPFLRERTKEEYVAFVEEFFPPLAETLEGGGTSLQCDVTRVPPPAQDSVSVTPAEAEERIAADASTLVLDVRTSHEWESATGHLAGAILIPVQDLAERIGELEGHKGRPMIVYCRTQNRSRSAAAFLKESGFRAAFMTGGITQWNAERRPVSIEPRRKP